MAFIKSRKHAAPAARTVGAAVLLTFAHAAAASDTVDAPPQQAKASEGAKPQRLFSISSRP